MARGTGARRPGLDERIERMDAVMAESADLRRLLDGIFPVQAAGAAEPEPVQPPDVVAAADAVEGYLADHHRLFPAARARWQA